MAAVEEPAGGSYVPGLRSSPARGDRARAQATPVGVCRVGPFVSPPNTMLPGGRGPRSSPHPARHGASGALMIRPASDAGQYRIIVQGECGSLLASLVDNVRVDVSPEDGDTCVVALVRDDPEFWGLME